MSLERILEPEVMDTPEEAHDYNEMDHADVNRLFVDDFLQAGGCGPDLLDLGTGTALIPIELCQREDGWRVLGVDAAAEMLELARQNVQSARLEERIRLQQVDAKQMPFANEMFDGVISNSIIHHIPRPADCLVDAIRVTRVDGLLFFRDLLRPASQQQLTELVTAYTGDENEHSRKMFAESLHAALSLDEIRDLVGQLGFPPESVQQTSDRHWTWIGRRAS